MVSGAAIERTRLAWRRTTLSATAVLALAVSRAVTSGGNPLSIVACALMTLIWLAILGLAHRRIRTLSQPTPPNVLNRTPARLAILVTVIGLLGAIVIAAPRA